MSRTRILSVSALAACATLALAGCGGSSSADGATQGATQAPQQTSPQLPGASGKIAAVSGASFQVQSQTAQTKVTTTDSTKFTQTKTGSLGDIKPGDCIVANGADASGSSVTASVINVISTTGGDCRSGFPGGGAGPDGAGPGGTPPSGAPTGFPGGGTPPSGMPSGGPGGAGGGFTMASGKVTSVTSKGVVVSGRLITVGSGGPTSSEGSVTVTLASDGKVLTEASATASAIKVGHCARARGEVDDKGTVTATTVNVSAPVDGDCRGSDGFFGAGRPSP